MDNQDIHKLKQYITVVLEPMRAMEEESVDRWSTTAKTAEGLDLGHAYNMRQYHQGRLRAFTFAISELKELYAEELKEGE